MTKSSFNTCTHTKPLFSELGLLNLPQLRYAQTCEFMYKYFNNLLPVTFTSYFDPIVNTICTRSYRDYRVIIPRTNIRKFSLKYQGPSLWNDLPIGKFVLLSV